MFFLNPNVTSQFIVEMQSSKVATSMQANWWLLSQITNIISLKRGKGLFLLRGKVKTNNK